MVIAENNESGENDPLYGVMIEDTWVVGWHIEDCDFIIECEISLWPGNKYYETPKKGEWTCYKRGKFIFKNAEGLSKIIPIEKVPPVGMENEIDYGALDSVVLNDKYLTIYGPFGEVKTKINNFEYTVE